jgi:hypothetical protein
MSVTASSVEFTTTNDVVYLDGDQLADGTGELDGPPFIIHGVALGPDDVTRGQSGVKKVWPADELRKAADSLEGTELVEDHENNSRGVIGEVMKAGFKDDVGIIYEAELDDEELARKIQNGRLDVSVRGLHKSVDELDETDDGAKIVEDIVFDNLSIVADGASPSNSVRMGEHDELSAAALAQFTQELESSYEPADYVKWDDGHGIVFEVDGDELLVELMEESGGMWRAIGEQATVSMSDVTEWNVDEEEDIGSPQDEDSEENMRCIKHIEELMDAEIPMPGDAQLLYPSEEKARQVAKMMGLDGIHPHDFEDETWYMPGEDHAAFEKVMEDMSVEENAALIEEGMKFFSTINNSEVYVKNVSGKMSTVQVVGGDAMWKEPEDNVIRKLADGDWEYAGRMDESEMAEEPNYSQGDWVRWNTRNSTEIGTVTGSYTEGDDLPDFRGSRGLSPEEGEYLYALRMYKQRDGTWHPIEGKPIGHYEDSLRSAEEPSDVSDSLVELVQSDVDVTGVERTALLASEPLVDRPTNGERRATFHTPLVGEFDESDVSEALSIAEEELGKEITVEMTDEGVFVQPVADTGVGVVEFMHEHLDVIESSFDNTIDIQQKSTLFIGGDADGYSVQPCFMMEDRLSDEQLDEIARLCKFVTGVDSNPYYAENRLYLDTGQNTLAHANLDIAEIIVRRMADAADIGIQSHSFKVLEETATELGRSNHEMYDVEKHDWVQWYPSGTTEEHGFVIDVEDSDDGDESIVTIEVWTQNPDGEWETDGEEITKTMEQVEPWGNFPRKQEEFADAIDGEDPRRAVKPSEEENASEELISNEVEQALKEKVEKHNEEYGDEDGKRITYRMLKNVFNRGMGAYQDSHREGMSPQQWSYARVNAFLYLVRNGNPENDQYTQDNDLLPDDHPKASDTEESSQLMGPPEFDEGDMVQWQVEPDLFGEIVHNPEDEPVIMVEVMDRTDDGFETTYHTISAYPSDIMHMDESMMQSAGELADMDELDRVYADWEDSVNMTASELRDWSTHPCSREASMDPEAVMKRNLRLLETNKSDWTEEDIVDAKRTISFVARMSDEANEPDEPMDGPNGCPSEWGISLMNWAHNPFDSMPEVPEGMDSVDEVTLSTFERPEGAEEPIHGTDKCNQPHRFPEHSCRHCSDELAEYEMHEPNWTGTTEMEWSSPDYSEFREEYGFDENFADLSDEEKETVANHFMVARGGFPGETYSDLKLPVVEPNGELSRNALLAVKGGRGASAVDGLSEEMESDIMEWVNSTANDPDVFDEDWGDEEEMMDYDNRHENARRMLEDFLDIDGNSEDDTVVKFEGYANRSDVTTVVEQFMSMDGMTRRSTVEEFGEWLSDTSSQAYGDSNGMMDEDEEADEMSASAVTVMTGDDLRQENNGASVSAATQVPDNVIIGDSTMDDELEAELSKLDEPAAVEQSTFEELQEKAAKYDSMEEDIASLRERTEVLDEVSRETVEELAEMDEPRIVEESEYEQLSDEAEEVKTVYAEKVAEDTPFEASELAETYDIGTLREKFEDMGHSTDELASTDEPEPKSADASEEELEAASDDAEETDEAELEQERKQAQAELRERMGLSGGD